MLKRYPFSIAAAYFVVLIMLAHFFILPPYSWTQNTISDLAAQGHAHKWIMQTGFIGFGLLVTWGAVSHFNRNRRAYFLLPVTVYGLSILMSGIFCTAPIDPSIPYAVRESELHSLFATMAGIAMSLAIFWQIVVSSNRRQRWTRILFFVLVVGISALFGLAENQTIGLDQGIVQRVLYLVGLGWLVFEEQLLQGKAKVK
jgi:hypothetical membrane protein